MQAMSNWDYSAIVKELNHSDAFFDKFYICTNGALLLRLRKKGAINIVANQHSLHETKNPPVALEKPLQFAMVVRKWLKNGKLKTVEQVNDDRIIRMRFFHEGEYSLVFEQFGKGNALLLREEEIVDALNRDFAARRLKPREKYFPPPVKKNLGEAKPGDLRTSGKTVAALTNEVNAPPFYVEEAVARLSLSNDVSKLGEADKQRLLDELVKMKNEFSPRVYLEKGKPACFSFVELAKAKHLEARCFPTFSQAVEFYYENSEEKKVDEGETKVATRLEFQKKALIDYRKKEEESGKIAETLYANYEFFDELLATTKKMMQEKKSEAEIEKKLTTNAEKNKAGIKVKNGKIEVEI